MLHAAMIAIGGQYSNDTSVKRKSRILHDRCIKLLERRDHEALAEPDRLCDYQAIFLIEVHSQYRARRAAKVLSPRFGKVYQKSVEDFRHITSHINDLVSGSDQLNIATPDRWVQWIELAAWQRLLVACYILESQQALLLAREPVPSLIQDAGYHLPFPGHLSTWNAVDATEWAMTVQRHPLLSQYVHQITFESEPQPFDVFQSSLLIAAHYNRSGSSAPYVATPDDFELEHLLDPSPVIMRQLMTARLVRLTPIRALLAVSGESWILSEKVPSAQMFTTLKTVLRTWLTELWASRPSESQPPPAKLALGLAVNILEQALKEQRDSVTLDVGTDMGIYFAALLLWAVTTAANTRIKGPQNAQQPVAHRHSTAPDLVGSGPKPTASLSAQMWNISQREAVTQPVTSSTGTQDAERILSHTQIIIDTISFLSSVLGDLGDPTSLPPLCSNLGRCQTGSVSLLLWVKLRLRGVALNDETSGTDAWTSRPNEGLGELLDGVTGSLERILSRGWNGWGI